MSQIQECIEGPTVEDQSREIIQNLAVLATGVSTVAEAIAKSYTELPTSEAAIGIQESKDLTEAREKTTKNLVLFRKLHRPLGDEVVNDLVETLDFFSVDDFDQFNALVPVVLEQVLEAEDRATFVRDLYDKLTSDLRKLGEDASRALKAAELKAKAKLDSSKAKGKTAKIIAGVAGAAMSVGVGGGLVLAANLLSPGGLLFYPPLAPFAFITGTTVGAAAASVPAVAATVVNY